MDYKEKDEIKKLVRSVCIETFSKILEAHKSQIVNAVMGATQEYLRNLYGIKEDKPQFGIVPIASTIKCVTMKIQEEIEANMPEFRVIVETIQQKKGE